MLTGTAYLPEASVVMASGGITEVSSVQTEQTILITAQPDDISAKPGQKVTFRVSASGRDLKYQWYFQKANAAAWSKWRGHDTSRTSASANTTWDGMLVRCEITDSYGNSVYSRSARIKTDIPLQIISQPADTIAVLGERTKFSVKAAGSSLKYQWYFKKAGALLWTEWKGHNTAVTSAVSNKTWEKMQLICIITDGSGASVTSESITVTLDSPLTVTEQPEDTTYDLDGTATFRAKASGIDVRYCWYYKKNGQTEWRKWGKRTTSQTTAKVNSTWEGMQVKCVITDNLGRMAETVPAKITVNAPLSITTQPSDVCVVINGKADFNIAASGIGLSYQWYIKKEDDTSWSQWDTLDSADICAISDASWHNMKVKCIVTDNVGKTVSSKAVTVKIDTTGYPDYLVSLLDRNKEAKEFVLNYPLNKDTYNGVTFNLTEYKNSKTIPLFIQWDNRWGYNKYGTGCIGTSGCGPTALSMVAMYMLNDTTLTPDKMAKFAIKNGYCIPGSGSSWKLMDKGAAKLGIKSTEIANSEKAIKNQLKKGHPIIAIMGKGYFTTGGHFIVFTDYVNGKIKVNDSNSYINSEKLWKYSDIKKQIRNLWAYSKP